MLVKFFNRGTGKGSSVMSYLVQPVNANGQRREPLPVVLSGEPTLCAALIDSIERKHKYTSGVIAFHDEDKPTPEQQIEVMSEFERVAFAGLEPDQYQCCWVKHEHCGNVELHFVTPKTELRSNKQLNIKPPGSTKVFDTFRNYFNTKNGWADPDAPERAQDIKIQLNQSMTQKQAKEVLHGYIAQCKEQMLNQQLDYTRESLTSDLNALDGVSVSRTTKNAVSVKLDGQERAIRLTGAVYEEQYSALRASDTKEAATENRSHRERTSERNRHTEEKLSRIIDSRSKFNRERYGSFTEENSIRLESNERQYQQFSERVQHTPQRANQPTQNDFSQTSQNTTAVKDYEETNQTKHSLDYVNDIDFNNSSHWTSNRGVYSHGIPEKRGVVLDVSQSKSRSSTHDISPTTERSPNRKTESTSLLQRVNNHLRQANRVYRQLREYQEQLTIRIREHYQRARDILTASESSKKQIERDRERLNDIIKFGERFTASKPYSVRHHLNNSNALEIANHLKQQHQQEQELSYRRTKSRGMDFGM